LWKEASTSNNIYYITSTFEVVSSFEYLVAHKHVVGLRHAFSILVGSSRIEIRKLNLADRSFLDLLLLGRPFIPNQAAQTSLWTALEDLADLLFSDAMEDLAHLLFLEDFSFLDLAHTTYLPVLPLVAATCDLR
jgi:hypothetical protein